MSVERPETLKEWAQYISGLSGEDLWEQGIAANTLEFVKTLKEEGFSSADVRELFILFVRQYKQSQMAPPSGMPGQYLDYTDLLLSLG